MKTEIRLRDSGALDEVVGSVNGAGAVHLERMNKRGWWIRIGDVSVWLSSKKKIEVHYENNSAE